MDDKFYILVDQMKLLVKEAMICAKTVDDILFSKKPNEVAVIGYLNQASSLMHCAQAVYISNFDELEHNDIDELFHQFDVFANEVLSSIATNHSKQWSNIEYETLNDKFDYSVLSQ